MVLVIHDEGSDTQSLCPLLVTIGKKLYDKECRT